MRRLATLASIIVVLLAFVAGGAPVAADVDPNCPDILVLGSRGSGETAEGNEGFGPTAGEFWRQFQQRVPTNLSVKPWHNPYTAIAVAGTFRAFGTGGFAWVTRGYLGKYHKSVKEGRQLLTAELNARAACANTRFVLTGYSQGAQVTADVYAKLEPAIAGRVIGLALFGDPKFNSASRSAEGNFEVGRNGLLGTRAEFRIPGQVLSYCHFLDPVCQGVFDFRRNDRPVINKDDTAHTNYMSVGDGPGLPTYPLQAARAIVNRIRTAPVSTGPVAVITPVDGAVAGEQFRISGAQSYDAEDRPLTYDWDLDNSGEFATRGDGSGILCEIQQVGTHTIGLRVTNDAGQSHKTTATVTVVAPDEYSAPPKAPVSVVATPAADQQSATLTWQANPDGAPTETYDVLTSDGDLYAALTHGGTGSLTLPKEELPISLMVRAKNRVGEGDTSDPVAVTVAGPGKPAGDLNELWNNYGDQGGHWTGGDRTTSVPLPDGRTAWLFSDTFLGTVNADHTRPANSPMPHNTLVVQNADGSLGATLHGGTPAAPAPLVETPGSPLVYWVADGIVEGGSLKVLYNMYETTGGGGLDVRSAGTALATFSLPGLALTELRTLPVNPTVAWGAEILVDGGHTYVYGAEHGGDGPKGLRIARTSALGAAWEFWNGSGWSANEAESDRVLTGVGTAFSVTKVGAEYALVTMDGNTTFSSTVVGYPATAPTGPFGNPRTLYQAPTVSPGKPIIYYDTTVHPQYSSGGQLLVSYNVNSLNPADNYADARIYRPRFVSVDWLAAPPDPAELPQAPTDLTARDNGDGNATLTWEPVSGTGYVYRVYQRDVTLQSHFTRISGVYATPTATLPFLRDKHDYEFRVTAENAVGEGPPSNVAALTVHVGKPEPPSGLTAAADDRGAIRLHWTRTPSPGVVLYQVLRRDATADEPEFRPINFPDPASTQVTDRDLEHQHTYEYKVTAYRSGQTSDPTAVVTATARYAAPDAPSGLTATARDDGQIELVWQPPEDGAWYFVYMRDRTLDQQEYTKLIYPITTCCHMTMGYLQHDHDYEFVVSATNRGGEGPKSGPARATSAYPPVGPPSGLTAAAGDGKVTLSWTASATTGVWYWIYKRDLTLGEPRLTRLPYPTTTCCELPVEYLANNHEYEFAVSATGPAGESARTAPVRARPMAPLPARPENLTATPQSDGTIKLVWTESTPGTWFIVYMRDVSNGQAFTKIEYPVTECCALVATYLTHDHVYEFKVAATNPTGESPHSTVGRATARYAPPPAPGNLRGRSSGDGGIDIDWDPPAPGLYYWIQWRDATNGEAFQKTGYPTDQTNWRATSLRHDHVYEFKVTAQNQGGEGPTSATIQVTSRGGLPDTPANLTATAGDGQVTLNWSASSTPDVWYQVWMRDASAGQSWQPWQYPVTTCCSATAQSLTNGQTYEFKIAATNASGSSATSTVASARPMPPFPQAPTGLSAWAGDGKVTLNWSASATAGVWYWVEYRPAGGTWTRIHLPLTTCCAFTMTFLDNGTTYEFRVRSTNLSGDSAPSNVASARPMPPFPQAPSGLTASAGDGQVELRWNASATAGVWYWVEYRPANGAWTRMEVPLTTCCTFTMLYLSNATTYEFRVRSTNISGDSTPSNVASARPMPPFPQAPSGLRYRMNGGEIILDWSPSPTPNVYYYVYYRKGGGLPSRLLYPATATTASFYPDWGHVYEVYVTAINQSGESGGSRPVFPRVGPPDGTSRCATASGSFVPGLGPIPGATWRHPAATICGYRDGDRIEVVKSWNTSNYELYNGMFIYQIWDCDTGEQVHVDGTQVFDSSTPLRSWTSSTWFYMDWTHFYQVRVWGHGKIQNDSGFRTGQFGPAPSDGYPRFDAWSSCF